MFPPLLALLTGAAVGCGDDGQSSAPDEPLTVTAIDYGYVGLPDEVPAGTAIALVNDSEAEVHEFVAVRLDDDESRAVEELVQLPPAELGALFAGVETVIIAPPGADGFTVEGDGRLDTPGRYAIVCVIPTGADPDEYLAAAAEAEGGPPDVAGGPPHIAAGMFAELLVS
jgi:hypothetical protein